MAGETVFGSFGGKSIISCQSTIVQFQAAGLDYSGFFRRANSYTCRLGHEHGTAWLLMKASDLALMDSAQPQDLILGVGTSHLPITIKKLAIVSSQRLFPAGSQDPNGLHLVQAVDVRWFLRRTTINKRYNLRRYCTASDWINGTLKSCCGSYQPWTFADICEDIWGNFASFGTFFGGFSIWSTVTNSVINQHGNIFGGDPANEIPENIRFEGVSALEALATLCQQFGYFLRYNPGTGSLTILKIGYTPDPNPGSDGWMENGFGGAKTLLAGNNTRFPDTPAFTPRTSDDGLNEDTEAFIGVSYVPASVNVVFQNNGSGCNDTVVINSNSGRGWVYEIEKTAVAIRSATLNGSAYVYMDTVTPNTSVALYSSTFALFSTAALTTPTNLAALQIEATRIATDYYRTLGTHSAGRIIYIGTKDIIPGPSVCESTWREWGDGLKTEIAKMPIPVGLPKMPRMFSESDSPAPVTTTLISTTTFQPPLPTSSYCTGTCRYTWSASTLSWTATFDHCSTTGTTTTIAPCVPNPKCTTSITTTGDPATSTSTTSTTSTSTTTQAPCHCIPPAYCGNADGECVSAQCGRGSISPLSCSTTTSTTGTSTTGTTCDCNTTTTLAPGCTAGCDWVYAPGIGWSLVTNGCLDTCGCPEPGFIGAICSTPSHTACVQDLPPVTTVDPGPDLPCGCPGPQICYNLYVDGMGHVSDYPITGYWAVTGATWMCDGSKWVIISTGSPCGFGQCGCGVEYPTDPCTTCGDTVWTPCVLIQQPDCSAYTTIAPASTTLSPTQACTAYCVARTSTTATTTTRTTSTAPPCSNCKFKWSGSAWGVILNGCSPCPCIVPQTPGTDVCQTVIGGCDTTTTTGTSTTTVTTSTSSTSTSTSSTSTSTTSTSTTSTSTSSTTTSSTTSTSTTSTSSTSTSTTCSPASGTCWMKCVGGFWAVSNVTNTGSAVASCCSEGSLAFCNATDPGHSPPQPTSVGCPCYSSEGTFIQGQCEGGSPCPATTTAGP